MGKESFSYCPGCGVQAQKGNQYCSNCGNALTLSQAVLDPQERNGVVGKLAAVLVVSVAIVAFGVFTLLPRTTDESSTSLPSAPVSVAAQTSDSSTPPTTEPTVAPEFNDADLASSFGDSVFRIDTVGCGYEGTGSGFAVNEFHIVTNRHVVEFDTTPTIISRDGTSFIGRVVGWREDPDIAVIRVDRSLPQPLTWAETDDLTEGDRLVSFGYPLPDNDFSVTPGTIVSFVSEGARRVGIRSDASLDRGNSGGPAMTTHGQVAGVVTEMDLNLDGFQFVPIIIPSNELVSKVDWIIDHPARPSAICDSIGAASPSGRKAPSYDHPTPPFYTVILASLSTGRSSSSAANDRADFLADTLGLVTWVLLSDNFGSLSPGYWVVYTGVFTNRFDALDFAEYLRSIGIDSYAREISWG